MSLSPAEFWSRAVDRRPGASEAALAETERALGVPLPGALREWLLFSDGAAGFVGPPPNDRFCQLLSTTELIETHADAAFMEQRPELVQFAGNGGGEGFFFDPARPGSPVLMIAYISNWVEDAIECGPTVASFFQRLYEGRGTHDERD